MRQLHPPGVASRRGRDTIAGMTGRQRIIALLNGQPTDSLPFMPITMQFAGDLIGVPYKRYVTDHRVLVEAQLRVAERFDVDYVSCISDPARESADCGALVLMPDDGPPAHDEDHPLLLDKGVLATLTAPDPLGGGRMTDRVRAVGLFKRKVGRDKLIEGWIEGPCAEGADLRGLNNLMLDFYDDPGFVNDLFAFAVEMELKFAQAQLDAGCDLIGIGDAAASLVGPDLYREIVWPYEKQMVDGVHAMGGLVRLHICGNTRRILADIGRLGCDIVDLDYFSPVAEAREAMGAKQVLLGNMDPVRILRNSGPETIIATLGECHAAAGARFIVGAGCEVPRDTVHAHLDAMRAYARNASVQADG